jgi:hypothetical protein
VPLIWAVVRTLIIDADQIHQPPQMMTGLDRPLLQLQVKLAGHVAQRVEGFFQMMGSIALAHPQRLQLMLRITDDFLFAIAAVMTSHFAAFVKNP